MATISSKHVFTLLLLGILVGCTRKPTPVVSTTTLPPTRPFLEFQPRAVQMLHMIAGSGKLKENWYIRLEVVFKPTAQIEVQVDTRPRKADDFSIEVSGLTCVMSKAQEPYLKGAYVEVVETQEKAFFDVTFPNRNEEDEEAATNWLRTEEAKREEQEAAKPKL